jgi:alanine-glyoxylate transaminase/serine-glyoxylate transaminase/serine-pyruvate transaminase
MQRLSETHRIDPAGLAPPPRLLLGPGPSNAHPRVLTAISTPQVGHLDPYFLNLMDEIQELLRYVFQTDNRLTVPVSGTGSAGMEACVANLVESGDRVAVGCNGYFGGRLAEMASRYGGEVERLTKPWGEVFALDELAAALTEHRPAVLGLVHAETSTGARQPLAGVAELCREHDCLLLVDTVTSLGGLPVKVDEWGIDAAYSGTQKCLSCPPGLAPVTFGPRASEKLAARRSSVISWYLDLSLVRKYWGGERTYHHTAPISMNYGLREALRLVAEEGLEERWRRHRETAEALWEGLAELGLACHVDGEHRLPSLTTIGVPEGVDAARVVKTLLADHEIEIGGGLGELAGRVWRVGLMGYNSRRENVDRLLAALRQVI